MGSRILSHQLSNGLYVSGRPEQPKEKPPTMSSAAMPYTGGDIKKSGELGKMFDIPTRTGTLGAASYSGPIMPNSGTRSKNSSGPTSSAGVTGTGSSNRQRSNSGPLNKQNDSMKKSSGQLSGGINAMARQNSGPLPLPATGLITSGPISSGPLNSSGVLRKVSGSMDSAGSAKMHNTSIAHNEAVININQEDDFSFKRTFPKPVLWAVILLFLMAFIAGGFILAAVHNAILLVVVAALFGIVSALLVWNLYWGRRAIKRFISHYPDADLRVAIDGQYVKISGIVTCGNVPLESSFEKVPRCVYTSTRLYEYWGWDSKPANSHHRRFTWSLRSMERHAVDFYISDFQSGLRALVKTGNGAKVIPYVDESVVLDIDPSKKDLSPEFLRWLSQRNLSSDDRMMRMKEGYVKEGSTVSVMGIIRRNDNVLMIVPPPEPVSTGCQWMNCVLPASTDGIILRCEDTSKLHVVPV